MVSSQVEDFNECNGWTNWATWCMSLQIDDDEHSYRLARYQNSPEKLQEFCEENPKAWSNFWEEDRFGNRYFNDEQWDNVNWEELFEKYKEVEDDE